MMRELIFSRNFRTDEPQNSAAFARHMEQELGRFGHVICISLVEQQGRERVLAQHFLKHVMLHDSPKVTMVTFDFHEYW